MTRDRDGYLEKLRRPEWQRRRLEILSRDNFTCANCGDDKTTLNVHHRYYDYGSEPWDYDDAALVTLCEPCHSVETEVSREIRGSVERLLQRSGMLAGDLKQLTVALAGAETFLPPGMLAFVIGVVFSDVALQFKLAWEIGRDNPDLVDFYDHQVTRLERCWPSVASHMRTEADRPAGIKYLREMVKKLREISAQGESSSA